ncbi:unnamed protein product [Calypogeia fissa]
MEVLGRATSDGGGADEVGAEGMGQRLKFWEEWGRARLQVMGDELIVGKERKWMELGGSFFGENNNECGGIEGGGGIGRLQQLRLITGKVDGRTQMERNYMEEKECPLGERVARGIGDSLGCKERKQGNYRFPMGFRN